MTEAIETQEQPQTDPFVDKAITAGWKPLEEFEGDPEQWIDAKEFIKRAPLYEKNHKLAKEVKELKTTLHEVKGYISKVAESAYNKAVRELTEKRDNAIEMGDKAQVKEIDQEIREAEALKAPTEGVHPAIVEFINAPENEWFKTEPKMRSFAQTYQDTLFANNPGITMEESLKAVSEAVKRAYPEKFEQSPERKKVPSVEAGGKRGGEKAFSKADLDDEARRVMNRFVRNGVMTEEEYIKGLVDSGALGGKK